MHRALSTLVAGCGLLACSPQLGTVGLESQVVTGHDSILSWEGSASASDTLTGAVPESCKLTGCDVFQFAVDLDDDYWTRHNGGVLVGIRWVPFNEENNLELYVYRDGEQVAVSEGFPSSGEAALVRNAPDGLYTVYIAYSSESQDAVVSYEGVVQVERFRKDVGPKPLLPDLVSIAARDIQFATGGLLFSGGAGDTVSCYPDEVLEAGAKKCMRFSQTVANLSSGNFELRMAVPHDDPTESMAIQRVYNTDESHSDHYAGEVEFHPTHGHFHFASFAKNELYASNAAGDRIGDEPASAGRKLGFCMVDVELFRFGERGVGPATYRVPDCTVFNDSDDEYNYMVNGITRGWADVYGWYLQGQYIEVGHLQDGYYILESRADPDNVVLELDETNNCTSVHLRLSEVATSKPKVEVLGPGPSC